MKNPYLQEATEIICWRLVYVADLGQIIMAKLMRWMKQVSHGFTASTSIK